MAQLIVTGTRRPDSDEAYGRYVEQAAPLLFGAGGEPTHQLGRTHQLAGDGPQVVLIMNFPDAETIQSVFDSPEYAAAIPDRDAAFTDIDIIIAAPIG